MGLCKTYKSGFLGFSGNEDVKALKNVYLEVPDGELFGILGHNGAGKTTLINILTGLISQSAGDAKMCGLRLSTQMDQIRTLIGVVP